jgi:hypothetical protein
MIRFGLYAALQKKGGQQMILTQAELAKELEVTRARITQFIDRGMPVREDRRIDLLKGVRWLCDNLDGGRSLGHAREWLRLLSH